MKIVDRLKNRETLTPTENEIAVYIRTNPAKAVSMSLEEFSDTIYVSKSTIIRFCKKFGFHGHKELCVELAKELNTFASDEEDADLSAPYSKGDSAAETARKMTALSHRAVNDAYSSLSYDSLAEMARMIRNAQAVTLYANEETWLAVTDLTYRLQLLGYHVQNTASPVSPLRTASSQRENVPALFVTGSTREPLLLQSARILNERKIPVCLISGPNIGTLGKLAAVSAEVSVYEPQPKFGASASRTGTFLALDILYGIIFNLDYEKNQAALSNAPDSRPAAQEGTEPA
ncbi:MAG: MurR/RpiR family transcriptional regulator [Solobacterium sp.]|nr:MurR/RpiR family transcriptional regulator [Solobacterium sp.]